MRTRLGALAALVTAFALVAPGVAGADVATKAPKGFRTVAVEDAGFSVAVPRSWTAIDLTSDDAQDDVDAAKERFPDLSDQLPDDVSELASQGVVMFATERDDGDGFNSNVNVILIPGLDEDPAIGDIEGQLPAGAEDAEVTETTVAGGPAIKAEYLLAKGQATLALTQYALVGPEGGLIVTLTGSEESPDTGLLTKIVKSLQLLD